MVFPGWDCSRSLGFFALGLRSVGPLFLRPRRSAAAAAARFLLFLSGEKSAWDPVWAPARSLDRAAARRAAALEDWLLLEVGGDQGQGSADAPHALSSDPSLPFGGLLFVFGLLQAVEQDTGIADDLAGDVAENDGVFFGHGFPLRIFSFQLHKSPVGKKKFGLLLLRSGTDLRMPVSTVLLWTPACRPGLMMRRVFPPGVRGGPDISPKLPGRTAPPTRTMSETRTR